MTPANRLVDAHLGHDKHDLPVKKVDGTVIHVSDVAYAHDGSPPQTYIARVNRAKAVLRSILNAGSSSTLREGAIAAALTGPIILLFLGSWRSTNIITVEIPLAILFSAHRIVSDH